MNYHNKNAAILGLTECISKQPKLRGFMKITEVGGRKTNIVAFRRIIQHLSGSLVSKEELFTSLCCCFLN